MLKNFVQARTKERVSFSRVFDDGRGNGFWFPCNVDGELLTKEMTDCAMNNYRDCMKNPERFSRYNAVVAERNTYTEAAHGTCTCGAEVELYDQYYGACQCGQCGRWYNLFGQSLLPPEQWDRDPSEEEYYGDW